jgi:hypothetical protein
MRGRTTRPVAADSATATASACVRSASAYGTRMSCSWPRTAATNARSTATRAESGSLGTVRAPSPSRTTSSVSLTASASPSA